MLLLTVTSHVTRDRLGYMTVAVIVKFYYDV